jgi:hypothetical protein
MTRRRSEKTAETDAKVEAAVEGLSNGLYKTPYAAATAHGLSRATLSRRLDGGNSRAEGKENQQNLTHAEEKALARWLTQLTATGHPARHSFIREIAEEIRKQRRSSSTTPISYPALGDSWVPQFLNRHPTLHTTISRLIESARIKDVTSASIVNFFEVFRSILEDNQITLENVYNMDETGLLTYCFTDNRIWNRRKSIQLCRRRFYPSSKVSSGTRETRVDYSH